MTTDQQTPESLRAALADSLARTEILQRTSDRHVQALEFYGRAENWREGAGTGPGRPSACVRDGGQIARQALDPDGMNVGGGA